MEREIKFRGWFDDIGMREVTDTETGCILMQYIGLKDKNGKEIYEGDILRIKHYGEPYGVCTITYIPERGGFYRQGKEDIGSIRGDAMDYHSPSFKQEIIGNIYENPELLEKTNQKSIKPFK